MATHSSTLAWKIPWTEEPGGATVHGVAKSWTRLSDLTSFHFESLKLVWSCFFLLVLLLLPLLLKHWHSSSEQRVPPFPGLRRSPGGGNDNPLQYSCLENSMDRGARQAIVHGVTESDRTEPLTTLA